MAATPCPTPVLKELDYRELPTNCDKTRFYLFSAHRYCLYKTLGEQVPKLDQQVEKTLAFVARQLELKDRNCPLQTDEQLEWDSIQRRMDMKSHPAVSLAGYSTLFRAGHVSSHEPSGAVINYLFWYTRGDENWEHVTDPSSNFHSIVERLDRLSFAITLLSTTLMSLSFGKKMAFSAMCKEKDWENLIATKLSELFEEAKPLVLHTLKLSNRSDEDRARLVAEMTKIGLKHLCQKKPAGN